MSNKRQMIIDRLWQMKKAAQEIHVLCEKMECKDCPADEVLYGCGTGCSIHDMEIPEE